MKEINLYDVPKAMVFHGQGYSDKIYIGFKGKYCQLNVSSEQVKDMLCTGEWSLIVGEVKL